jgi:DNA-binding NarL/FixJ family response regulator
MTEPSDPVGALTERVRVVVVDDQGVIRTGLRMIVDNEPDLVVVGEAADGLAAIEVVAGTRPDVVLMDIRMPRLDGLAATGRIVAGSRAAVLVLTTFDDDEYVLGAIRAGASGFLLKDAGPDALVAAIRSVARGDALVDPAVTRTVISRCLELELAAAPPTSAAAPATARWADRLTQLSDREQEILVALARGLANRDIAREFVVTEATVKSHVSSLLAKLGVRSRVEAVVLAYEAGVVTPGDPGHLDHLEQPGRTAL